MVAKVGGAAAAAPRERSTENENRDKLPFRVLCELERLETPQNTVCTETDTTTQLPLVVKCSHKSTERRMAARAGCPRHTHTHIRVSATARTVAAAAHPHLFHRRPRRRHGEITRHRDAAARVAELVEAVHLPLRVSKLYARSPLAASHTTLSKYAVHMAWDVHKMDEIMRMPAAPTFSLRADKATIHPLHAPRCEHKSLALDDQTTPTRHQ
jgi:hypothetical protein